jgi:hypothetical protein
MADEPTNIYEDLGAVYGSGKIYSSADHHSFHQIANKD